MKTFFYTAFYLVSMAAMFFLMRSCCSQPDGIVVKHDTTYAHFTQVIHDTPVVRNRSTFNDVHHQRDTIYLENYAEVDTQGIVKAYFDRLYYTDTVNTAYGKEIIYDTVYSNHLQGRSIITDFNFPQVTTEKTVTKTIPPKRKLLAGFDIGFGLGAGAAYQDRKDRYYGADYFFTQHGGILMVTYKRVLTFR